MSNGRPGPGGDRPDPEEMFNKLMAAMMLEGMLKSGRVPAPPPPVSKPELLRIMADYIDGAGPMANTGDMLEYLYQKFNGKMRAYQMFHLQEKALKLIHVATGDED